MRSFFESLTSFMYSSIFDSRRALSRSLCARSASFLSLRAFDSKSPRTAFERRETRRRASLWKALNSSAWYSSFAKKLSRDRLFRASASASRFRSSRSASRASRGCLGRRGRTKRRAASASSRSAVPSAWERTSARSRRCIAISPASGRSSASCTWTGCGRPAGTTRTCRCLSRSRSSSASSAEAAAAASAAGEHSAALMLGVATAPVACQTAAGGAKPRFRWR
mmetsp:Transcript_27612/g.90579  ORF Transcript_27612/g.90579 Transcript_27612/m.90579 type:complete len:224 (+) Transcript_27612:182-853(+)